MIILAKRQANIQWKLAEQSDRCTLLPGDCGSIQFVLYE